MTSDQELPGVCVLKNWSEAGAAINELTNRLHRLHRTPAKTWALRLIHQMARSIPRSELVVDVGASVLGAVRLLHEMGFQQVEGYDLFFFDFRPSSSGPGLARHHGDKIPSFPRSLSPQYA